MGHVLIVLCTFCGLSSQARAGAWPLPKGHGQTIATTVYDNASRGFDDQWNLSSDVTFSKLDSQFFWEHGYTDRLTLVATTAFQDVDFVSRTGEKKVSGFGTSSLGARYQLYGWESAALAVQGSFVLSGPGEVIADADLGQGGNGIEIRGLAGKSFELMGRDGFADLQAAWIYRGDKSPNTLKIDASAGINISKKRQVIGQAFYSQTQEYILGNDRILPNEFIKLQGSLVTHRSKRTSVQFGFFQTVAGRNIVQEKGVFAAIWRRY